MMQDNKPLYKAGDKVRVYSSVLANKYYGTTTTIAKIYDKLDPIYNRFPTYALVGFKELFSELDLRIIKE